MGSDRARVSYDPKQQYRSVVMQQGRVTLEADFNEELAIAGEELREETLDIVGPSGTPDNGYLITPLSTPPFDFSVRPGTMYVGGLRVTTPSLVPVAAPVGQAVGLIGGVRYTAQTDWLDHSDDPEWVEISPNNPPTNEFIYLFLREQEVSAVEDSDLKDVALGGPDTAQRTRLIQHIVRLSDGQDCATGLLAARNKWKTEGLGFDPRTMQLVSTATMKVTPSPSGPPPDSCNPQAQSGYLGADNELIRVQISGTDQATGNPKFVWGFDDASFLYRLDLDKNNKQLLHLQSRPVDASHNPRANQAVEVLRSAAELSNGEYVASLSGVVFTLDKDYNPDTQIISLPATLTKLPDEYYDPTQTPRVFLRVWEEELVFTPDTAVDLGNTGLQVTFDLHGGVFHLGDYWLFAVRPSTPQQVYPERYLADFQPPEGPRMWACPLGVIGWNQQTGTLLADCRNPFDNLVELTKRKGLGGCCTVSISPKDLTASNTLQSVVDKFVTPALVLTAADAGSPGNGIVFSVTNVVPALDPLKAQLSISLVDDYTYTGLTLSNIKSMLAASLGLVHVVGEVSSGQVQNTAPTALVGGTANKKATTSFTNDQGGTIFTLEAKKAGVAGNSTIVVIENVDPNAQTFDLRVRYDGVQSITLEQLGQNSNERLAYDVVVSAPSGGAFSIPSLGVTYLSGGTDGASATQASATVFAEQQNKVCFAPGVYELTQTLELDRRHSGLTLEGCSGEVILRAAAGAEANFLHGLVLLNSPGNVTFRGLTFNLPAVPFVEAGGTLAGLDTSKLNRIGGPQIQDLIVSVGLRPLACSDLTVEDCTFNFQVAESGVFEAGILAGAANNGFVLKNSQFLHKSAEEVVRENTFATRFGYLLTPSVTATFAADGRLKGTVVESELLDAYFHNNQFIGLTAAALIYAATGALRVDNNTIRNCYSGFWVLTLRSIRTKDASNQFLEAALLLDPVVLFGSVLSRSYPLPSDFQYKPIPVQAAPAQSHPLSPVRDQVGPVSDQVERFFRLCLLLLALEDAALDQVRNRTPLALNASQNDIGALQGFGIIGTPDVLKPAASSGGDQSACGFMILGDSDTPTEVILNGNTIHNSNDNYMTFTNLRPQGLPTVAILFVRRCSVTGNQIMNEPSLGPPGGNSLVLVPAPIKASAPLVAVTGNILQRPAVYPARDFTPTLGPPFNSWDFMNTVIP